MLEQLSDAVPDETSPIPAYYQVYEALRAKLADGSVPAGAKLPTERALAEHLRISRATLRQALSRLEQDGLIMRRQGNGTFVGEPRIEHDLHQLRGFTSEFTARGRRVESAVLSLRTAPTPARLAVTLGVGREQDAVVELRRVRSLDGSPMSLETVWLPAHRCGGLLDYDLNNGSLYAALHELGVVPARAEETLMATVLDEYEAAHLDQRPGAASFLIERVTYDAAGDCVECVRTLLRADRFQVRTTLDLAGPSDESAVTDQTPSS